MKLFSIPQVVRIALCSGLMIFVVSVGFTADTESNGMVSQQLAHALFCDTAHMMEGDIGLMIGLLLVFSGLWSLIQGSKIATALPVIIIGSLITAIPSLIISTASGFGVLLTESEISSADTGNFLTTAMQQCPDSKNIVDKAQSEVQSGESLGTLAPNKLSPESGYCKSKPEDARCN